MAEPLNEVIATIPKNSREELRVTLSEFKATQFLNIRIYADTAAGEARGPTKQGVTCSFANLPALRKALADAEERARALGLLQ